MSFPDGYSAPAYEISSNDRGGLLVIVNGNALIVILFFLALRTSRRVPSLANLTLDDLTIIAASVLAVIQIALNFHATHLGFGKKTNKLELGVETEIDRTLYASDLIYLVSLGSSKISAMILARRLSPDRRYQILMNGSLALTITFSVVSVVLIALGCKTSHAGLTLMPDCKNLYPRWVAVCVFGILVEVLLFAEVVSLLAGVQRPWSKKWKGIVAFGMRLLVIPMAILRLSAIHQESNSSNHYFSGITTACWTQAELAYSIAASTILCLTPFMMKLNTNMGAMGAETVKNPGYLYSNHAGTSSSYELSSRIGRDGFADTSSSVGRLSSGGIRTTILASGKSRRHSMSSDGSTREIIRKDVDITFSVETENQRSQ